MASEVYFADLRAHSPGESTVNKVRQLFEQAGFADLIAEDDLTAIKLHFGERGNHGFVSPVFVRPVVDHVRALGGRPFLTDTNTLYSGSRDNAVDHLHTATGHGFVDAVTGAPVIIADGVVSDHFAEVPIHKKHFAQVKIAGGIFSAESMIVMSHFKGHGLAGFGGAIKNLGMGCAPAAGKMDQHAGLRPSIDRDLCTGCGQCVEICPRSALGLDGETARINREACIGCGECITVCQSGGIAFDWEHDVPVFLEMMTEYACGAVSGKDQKVGYFNFLLHITPDCDCVPWSDAPIVPDIGILASTDPVAIDAASHAMVNAHTGCKDSLLMTGHAPGEDKFRGVWAHTCGEVQIRYAEELGMGSSEYRVIGI